MDLQVYKETLNIPALCINAQDFFQFKAGIRADESNPFLLIVPVEDTADPGGEPISFFIPKILQHRTKDMDLAIYMRESCSPELRKRVLQMAYLPDLFFTPFISILHL